MREPRPRGARSRPLRTLLRIGRLRCPRCGGSGLLRSWLGLADRCPVCRLRTDRAERDHFLGAMLLNLVVAELAAAALVTGSLLLLGPDLSWEALTWAAVGLVVLLPVLFYPFSRLLWLALDLWLRPEAEGKAEGDPPQRGISKPR